MPTWLAVIQMQVTATRHYKIITNDCEPKEQHPRARCLSIAYDSTTAVQFYIRVRNKQAQMMSIYELRLLALTGRGIWAGAVVAQQQFPLLLTLVTRDTRDAQEIR